MRQYGQEPFLNNHGTQDQLRAWQRRLGNDELHRTIELLQRDEGGGGVGSETLG